MPIAPLINALAQLLQRDSVRHVVISPAVSKTVEAVEKVLVGLVGAPKTDPNSTKRVQNVRNTEFFGSEQDSEKGANGFFNTLGRFGDGDRVGFPITLITDNQQLLFSWRELLNQFCYQILTTSLFADINSSSKRRFSSSEK